MDGHAGLDMGLERIGCWVLDGAGAVLGRGGADTQSGMIAQTLSRWRDGLGKPGPGTGLMTPWCARGLRAPGRPVVVMDARRAADALTARPVKADRADARALAGMLQTRRDMQVSVRSGDSHRLKAPLVSRDRLVKMNRQVCGRIRGVPGPFGIRLPGRAGTARLDAAARAMTASSMPASQPCARRPVRSGPGSRRWTRACRDPAALEGVLASGLRSGRRTGRGGLSRHGRAPRAVPPGTGHGTSAPVQA